MCLPNLVDHLEAILFLQTLSTTGLTYYSYNISKILPLSFSECEQPNENTLQDSVVEQERLKNSVPIGIVSWPWKSDRRNMHLFEEIFSVLKRDHFPIGKNSQTKTKMAIESKVKRFLITLDSDS